MPESQDTLPIGFRPDALPVYTDLDPNRFEDFCEALLNLNPTIACLREGRVVDRRILHANRLLQGVAQDGVDIRAEADAGEVWFFQCKHVQKFSPTQARKAIKLAEEGFPQADQFVLVTTCVLGPDAQREIDNRPRWRSWSASHITAQVLKLRPRENAINLVKQFFGADASRKIFLNSDHPLLTWREFFAKDLTPENKTFHHRAKFILGSGTVEQLERFARSGSGRALILSAPGGRGKSRTLLELARRLEQIPNSPRVAFLNLSRLGLNNEQAEFLGREDEDLLLIVDDAHRLDTALEDVGRTVGKLPSVRLLVATRPQAVHAVTSRLYDFGYADKIDKYHLPEWSQEEIRALAEEVLVSKNPIHAGNLAALADRCPLLVILGGELINSGEGLGAVQDHQTFRQRVFRSFKEEFLNRQPEAKRGQFERLIRFLSFVSPVPRNEVLLSKAAEILESSALDISDALDSLQAAELLIENREGVRLYPDLFADAVLLDACLDQSGKASELYRRIVKNLSASDFPALMRNLAQADWEARSKKGTKESLFDPIWNEFLQRFQDADWPTPIRFSDYLREDRQAAQFKEGIEAARRKDSREPAEEGAATNITKKVDRAELLNEWAAFAIFLPMRTLELAEFAIQAASCKDERPKTNLGEGARSCVSSALPPLLKPIVIWHQDFANRALEILWSLDVDEPRGNWNSYDSNAISAIASCAGYEIEKPLSVSEIVLDWLDKKSKEPSAVERLRSQPWILSGLLKPFFGREVEHNWVTGRTMHTLTRPIAVERTRPLRRKALQIATRFLNGCDIVFSHAIVPILEEAIRPPSKQFDDKASDAQQASFQIDRLDVLSVIEQCLKTHQSSPIVLLRLRRVLRNRCGHDSDEIIRNECCRVLKAVPDSLELRVMLALTSTAYDEFPISSGDDFRTDLRSAEAKWEEFKKSVALELVGEFKTAELICDFIKNQISELTLTNSAVLGSALLYEIAGISPEWCGEILKELLSASDKTLDGTLWHVLRIAQEKAPDLYASAIRSLPTVGRPEQVSALIMHFGSKHLHGSGLTVIDRQAILEAANRKETDITLCLASIAGIHFDNEPLWAMEVLSNLKANSVHEGAEILKALSNIAGKHSSFLHSDTIRKCLKNIGEFSFPDSVSCEHDLQRIAKLFPTEIYEHFRDLQEEGEKIPSKHHWLDTLPLGRIDDSEFLDQEIRSLWENAVMAGPYSFGQKFRANLIRSLIWAKADEAAERIHSLIERCQDAEQLRLATTAVAPYGSQFVFQFPDLVRFLLQRSDSLLVAQDVRRELLLSACGGGRSFSEDELDPEYRYILEQASDLANRYRDDPLLSKFYRMVADSERRKVELHKRMFAQDGSEMP